MSWLSSSTDLAQQTAEQALELILPHTLPIFSINTTLQPEFEGTGVLLRIGKVYFLISAAHVFDALRTGACAIIPEYGDLSLTQDHVLTSPRVGTIRSYDPFDLGYSVLTAEQVTAIGAHRFLSRFDLAPQESAARTAPYLLVGYTARDAIPNRSAYSYRVPATRLLTLPAGATTYTRCKVKPESHLALKFIPREITGPHGKGEPPSFIGMSGGGVWRVNPLHTYSETNRPKLVSIFTERPQAYRKCLMTTRIELLLAMIRDRMPELEEFIPRSPLLKVKTFIR